MVRLRAHERIVPLRYAADFSGCPRNHLGPDDDLYLAIFGGNEEFTTSVIVSFLEVEEPAEVRSWRPEGNAFPLTNDLPTLKLIWHGSETRIGLFRILTFGPGWPELQHYVVTDINSGMTVQIHTIPPD